MHKLLRPLGLALALALPAASPAQDLAPLNIGASVNAVASVMAATLAPPPVPSSGGLMLNAVSTTATSTNVQTGIGVYAVDIQVWSAAGSTAKVLVECRSYYTAPWFPCYTIIDPDVGNTTASNYFSAPLAAEYRLRVSEWTVGAISGTIVVYK